jgi:hypothetical protein
VRAPQFNSRLRSAQVCQVLRSIVISRTRSGSCAARFFFLAGVGFEVGEPDFAGHFFAWELRRVDDELPVTRADGSAVAEAPEQVFVGRGFAVENGQHVLTVDAGGWGLSRVGERHEGRQQVHADHGAVPDLSWFWAARHAQDGGYVHASVEEALPCSRAEDFASSRVWFAVARARTSQVAPLSA